MPRSIYVAIKKQKYNKNTTVCQVQTTVICSILKQGGSGKISWCEKVGSAKNTRKIGINPLISSNYRLRYLKPMNLKSSITATHETKLEAKKLQKLSLVPCSTCMVWRSTCIKKHTQTTSMESCGVGKNSSSNPINFGSCPNPNPSIE
jgi:hypothetical protein